MKLKQLLISTASIAALAVVPMSIVSCGNNNNNSVDQLPPANGGDNNNSNPGGSTGGSNNDGSNNGGNNSNPDGSTGGSNNGGNNNNQQPTIQYIDVNDRNGMIAHILQSNYIVSEFIRQVTKRQINGTVTSVEWNKNLESIEPGSVSYHTDGSHYYYNVKNLTFTIRTNIEQGKAAALYYTIDNAEKKETVSANGSWTISVDLHFRSTNHITDISN